MEPRTDSGGDRPGDVAGAAHDLLLAMAGRLPDRLLWRLRDWLAAGAVTALRTALPRALVRHRVALTDREHDLLRAAVLGWGGSERLVAAVPHADGTPAPAATFEVDAETRALGWDVADLVLRALVPAVPGAVELRRARRSERGGRRAEPAAPTRVVLVSVSRADADLPALTAAVQRALRATGEPDPRVEVLGPDSSLTAYHRDALAASELLWRADGPASVDPVSAGVVHAVSVRGELVRHG